MYKIPERIESSRINSQQQMVFQVKWQGFSEMTWETEESLSKHKELIEDYHYFQLTSLRYDEKQLEEIRRKLQEHQPKLAVKRVPPVGDNVPRKRPQQTVIDITQDQRQGTKENVLNLVNHQNQNKISQSLLNKQSEIQKNLIQNYPNQQDQIELIKLIHQQENFIFEAHYKARQNGTQPSIDFFNFEQFKTLVPMLYIEFMETCFLGLKMKNSQITYEFDQKEYKQSFIEFIRK